MNGLTIERTEAADPRVQELIRLLDLDLEARYGPAPEIFKVKNKVDPAVKAVIGGVDGEWVACGCFRDFGDSKAELKRMFVRSDFRGRGLGGEIVSAIELWAVEEGFGTMVLETADGQPEAIGLYQKLGYLPIANYPPYDEIPTSRCMAKAIRALAG